MSSQLEQPTENILEKIFYTPSPIALTLLSYFHILDILKLSRLNSSWKSRIKGTNQFSYFLKTIKSKSLKEYNQETRNSLNYFNIKRRVPGYNTPQFWKSLRGLQLKGVIRRIDFRDSDLIGNDLFNFLGEFGGSVEEVFIGGCYGVNFGNLVDCLKSLGRVWGKINGVVEGGDEGIDKGLKSIKLKKVWVWGIGGFGVLIDYESKGGDRVKRKQLMERCEWLMERFETDLVYCRREGKVCETFLAEGTEIICRNIKEVCNICGKVDKEANCQWCKINNKCERCHEYTCDECLKGMFAIREVEGAGMGRMTQDHPTVTYKIRQNPKEDGPDDEEISPDSDPEPLDPQCLIKAKCGRPSRRLKCQEGHIYHAKCFDEFEERCSECNMFNCDNSGRCVDCMVGPCCSRWSWNECRLCDAIHCDLCGCGDRPNLCAF